ncbi:MAG: hypothetical protein JWN52_5200 [Actinomycetia bacterium]|nr:hypothetical protein [Actinomycetes bacterium]
MTGMRRAPLSLLLATCLIPGLVAGCASAGAKATVPVAQQAKAVAAFKHPGVLLGTSQLNLVRKKVLAGAQPWKSAYDAMRKSSYASLTWTAKARANVECGSKSNPNNGCSDERNDALAAYTDSLIWSISGDSRYAKKAIQIMDAWSGTIKQHTNSNAPLQTGWAGASFARAGEIIRYSKAGWSTARVNRFATMLRTVYLPTVIKGAATKNGNWELIMTDAAIGISVFLNDHASFNTAVATWRKRLPEYFYLKSDGALPKVPAGIVGKAATINYWQGQSTFVDGLGQETCRDFGHTGWGLDAAIHTAETARIQGVDLYAEGKVRLAKALEFHSSYQLGAPVPSSLCGGTLNKGLGPVLEVGYNALHNRLGVSLPQTAKLIAKSRPAGASYFLAWETLTHAAG